MHNGIHQHGSPRARRRQVFGKVVFQNDDVIFRQIDEHTWEGNGHLMANETVYIVEGNDKAVLIDAGTNIPGLRKIAEGDNL